MTQIPKPYKSKFQNGIKHPELYLWDSWSYFDENLIHLYCLAVSRKKPDGTILNPYHKNDFPFHIRHFTSDDNGFSWKDEGCFMESSKDLKAQYRTIWSGSVHPAPNGQKLVAYTGMENIDEEHKYLQNISLAVSNDGYAITAFQESALSSPIRDYEEIINKGYYLDSKENLGSNEGEENGPIMAWRDPFIFYDKANELNLFWAAKLNSVKAAMARAIVEKKGDLFAIKKLFPPVTVPDDDDFTQLEVPKVLFDEAKNIYYLLISTCNRLFEEQPESEVNKEVRLYKSKDINGPWESMGGKMLGEENLFGPTILKADFENDRLLCIAPHTEQATEDLRLTFAKTFYIHLNPLRVEFS